MLTRLAALAALALATACAPAQQTLEEGPITVAPVHRASPMLNNDAIIRMSKAGLDSGLILQTIRTQPGQYATSPDDLITLKEAGVPQPVIAAMLAHSSGLVDHASTAPVTASPLSPDIDEQGVYRKESDGRWTLLPAELVHYRSGGFLKSTLTNNIVKKDQNGEVSGGQATLVLKPGDELLILAPPNTEAVEYQLIRFRLHANSREFRTSTGGVFTTREGTDRDQVAVRPTRVAPRIFSLILPPTIGGGEFGVLPPGNASTPGIAFAGKAYTFAITENK